MNKTAERLLTFFIGIPIVLGCAAITWCSYLPLHIAILIATILTSFELHGILSKSMCTQNKALTIILSALIPLMTSLTVILNLPFETVIISMTTSVMMVFIVEIWGYDRTTRSFDKSLQRVSSSLLIVIYSGGLISFISRMAAFSNASAFICLFLLIIFGCDSCAWFFGVTMGKNNKGYVAASPNKSIMGFVGGYVGPFISIAVAIFFFPVLKTYPLWKLFVLAIATSTFAILGDLVESVLKRSSNTKDSGNIIPGRGGLLDSVDSVIFSAPVYYLLVRILLGM
ncbi:MAG: phosphatidate cytidylyltransferase [Treponema sp.]|nr:phosphatidate cytidylyltransferase [Candidatus Treponema caballi]